MVKVTGWTSVTESDETSSGEIVVHIMSVEVDDVELYELILSYLRTKETSLPILTHRSPHLENGDRGVIVEWIYNMCNHFHVSTGAQHLSVALFDYFIDSHHADKQGLYLVGAACLSIACKVEDIEINIPQASKLVQMIPLDDTTPTRFLKSTELLVLQHFDWQIHLPTEASFIDYYAASCLAMELESIANIEYRTTLTRYYNKWIAYFRDKTLLLDKLRGFRPSVVACGIVTASRMSLVMHPDWPSYMTDLTEITRDDLNDVVKILLNCLDEDLQIEQKPSPLVIQEAVGQQACPNQGDIEPSLILCTSSPLNSTGSSQPSTPALFQQPGMAGDFHNHHQHQNHHHLSRPASASSSSSYRLAAPRGSRATLAGATSSLAVTTRSQHSWTRIQDSSPQTVLPSGEVARQESSSTTRQVSRIRSRRKLRH